MVDTICFTAFGTRGDVQPLATVAEFMQRSGQAAQCVLVTHAAHQVWLHTAPWSNVRLVFVASTPARGWPGEKSTAMAPSTNDNSGTSTTSISQQRQQTLDAICACSPFLVVFNLFALEAYSIAEALQVPCVASSPYLIPYRCPTSFSRRFRQAFPQLYSSLKQAAEVTSDSAPSVTLSELQHWMWPLFTETWATWRQHVLHLAPVPLHDARTLQPLQPLPKAVPLLYGFSELIVPRPSYWPTSVCACGFWPLPTGWLGGMHLPDSLEALLGPARAQPSTGGGALPPGLAAVGGSTSAGDGTEAMPAMTATASLSGNVVCVDFGSSGHLGLIKDPEYTLQVIARAMNAWEGHALLLSSWQPLIDAHAGLNITLRHRIVLHSVSALQHALLLPRCTAVLHVGGSGTTAVALTVGTPQLLSPLHFDQHYWAERLAYLGLSPPPLDRDVLFRHTPEVTHSRYDRCWVDPRDQAADTLVDSLRTATSPGIAEAVTQMAKELAQENGLQAAACILAASAARSW